MKKAIAPLLAAIIFLLPGCGVFQFQSAPEPSSKACQDPAEEREFVNIMRITMFQGTNCVEARIMGGAVPGAGIPEEFLTFYYAMPEEISSVLREQAFGFEV